MCALDQQFKQYLHQAERSDELVGGVAVYIYNHWPWHKTVLLAWVAYVSLC